MALSAPFHFTKPLGHMYDKRLKAKWKWDTCWRQRVLDRIQKLVMAV